ncbi:MAG: TolB-like translocation protein [Planctomycetota bacterium]
MRPVQDVVIDPLEEQLRAIPKPDVIYGCSDCPPPNMFREAVRKTGGRSSESYIQYYTAAWRNGRMSETMYRAVSDGIVEEIGPDGTITVLFQKQIKGRFTTIKRLRVSPDEEFLAYSVYSKLRAPIPLPGGRDDIYIRHLPTGKEKRIASYSAAGNFMWSSDSKRLYFAATTSGFKEMGVRRVHVEQLFR